MASAAPPAAFPELLVASMLLPLVRRVEHTLPHGKLWQSMRRPIAAVVVSFGALVVMAFLLRWLTQPVIALNYGGKAWLKSSPLWGDPCASYSPTPAT